VPTRNTAREPRRHARSSGLCPRYASRLLITGFGPFPGAPENPTSALIEALRTDPPESLGASAFRAAVLPTDYRRSWETLRRIYRSYAPDIVVHFGLSKRAKAITIETVARKTCDPAKLDVAGYVPPSGQVRRSGPETRAVTVPVTGIVAALKDAGFQANLSEDAGGYVCNATLYRSLAAAPPGRSVGFVHVPPSEVLPPNDLLRAARIVLGAAISLPSLPGARGRGSYGPKTTENVAL
jgi:pyroglutamyl-peptidase